MIMLSKFSANNQNAEKHTPVSRLSPPLRTCTIRPMLSFFHCLNDQISCLFHAFTISSNYNRVIPVSTFWNIRRAASFLPYDPDTLTSLADHEIVMFRRNTEVPSTVPLILHGRYEIFEEVFGFL